MRALKVLEGFDLDDFTLMRLTRVLDCFKKNHGRDASQADLAAEGFGAEALNYALKKGIMIKYQVKTGKGSQENRYKLSKDWRSLNQP